jgi:cyclopropane fatty-acyl-phospholipid synthase-like methyltransferase
MTDSGLRSSEPASLGYRIVPIEMLEAAGESWWPTYFNMPRERLRVGGVIVLQTITIADERSLPFGVVAIPTALY